MSNCDIIRNLLLEVRPLIEAREIKEYNTPCAWTILVDDHLVIIECDDENSLLHLSTVLPTPSDEYRTEIYAEALRHSAQPQGKVNCRIGILEKGGDLVFIQTEPIVQFDRTAFYNLLKSHLEQVKSVSGMILNTAPAQNTIECISENLILHV